MGARQSVEVTKALKMVAKGEISAYKAAERCGISLSAMYRALRRQREADAAAGDVASSTPAVMPIASYKDGQPVYRKPKPA